MDLSVVDGSPVVCTVSPARYRLEDLFAEVRDDNLHAEASTGEPRGRERW